MIQSLQKPSIHHAALDGQHVFEFGIAFFGARGWKREAGGR